jgi:hypothetical protein
MFTGFTGGFFFAAAAVQTKKKIKQTQNPAQKDGARHGIWEV